LKLVLRIKNYWLQKRRIEGSLEIPKRADVRILLQTLIDSHMIKCVIIEVIMTKVIHRDVKPYVQSEQISCRDDPVQLLIGPARLRKGVFI
jgi:hypothetical protein